MSVNQFKTFADNAAAELYSLSEYLNGTARGIGNQNNTTANPSLNNRALRQATMVAEALGIIGNTYSIDFLDSDASTLSESIANTLARVAAKAAADALNDAMNTGGILSGRAAHNTLVDRDAANAHPMSAIAGLTKKLQDIEEQISGISSASVPDATEAVKGKARLATALEVETGADHTTIITPYSLRHTTFKENQIPNLNASKIASGVFSVDRIPGLDASKITSGTIDPARLPSTNTSNIDASQVISGVLAISRIPDLDASKTASGVFSINRIPDIPTSKLTGSIPASLISNYTGNIDASQVGSGVLASARIPGLDASKITSGTIDPARLPAGSGNTGNIDASQVVSGVLAAARIPDLNAAKIASGVFDINRIPAIPVSKIQGALDPNTIPNLDASKIVSGVFATARIPGLDASKITSGTFGASRIPSLDASKITSGTFDPARIPYIDAAKISSGVFSVDRIPKLPASKIEGGLGGDIDASQVTSGVFDILRIPDIPASKVYGRLSKNNLPTDVTALSTTYTFRVLDDISGAGGNYGARNIVKYFMTETTNQIGAIEMWMNMTCRYYRSFEVTGNILTFSPSLSQWWLFVDGAQNNIPESDWGAFGDVFLYSCSSLDGHNSPVYYGSNLTGIQRAPNCTGRIYGYTTDGSGNSAITFYAKLDSTWSVSDTDSIAFHALIPGWGRASGMGLS